MWTWLFYIGTAVLSYLFVRSRRSKVAEPGAVQAPEVPAGTPIPVAFGTVKLEPIYGSFEYGTFRNASWPKEAPAEYWVKWLGLLCWGPIDFKDIIYDDKRKLTDQGTQHAFSIVQNNQFFALDHAPSVTDTTMSAVAHGSIPSGTPHYSYAEIYLPQVFGGAPPDGEGGIAAVVQDPACVGRTVYGAPYIFYCGGDFATGAYLDVPPVDDLRYYGGPPKDGLCADDPTTSGAGRIAYERFAMVYFGGTDGGAVGFSPVLKKQEFVALARMPGESEITQLDGGQDANPVRVLYHLLTDPDWGLGINPSLLDTTNWSDQATGAGIVKFGISGVWREQKAAEEYINEILRTIDAVLYRHPETGLLCIKMIAADYALGDLQALNESNIESIEWTRRDIGDTTNEVTIAYTDRDRLFQRNVVTLQDHANIHNTGGVRSQTFEFPYVPTETWALKVGARELKANTLPLGRGTIRVTRSGWGIVPGDAVKLSYAKYGIANLPVRVLSVDYGEIDNGSIELEVVQDVYGLPDVPYTVVTPIDDVAATPLDHVVITATENNDGLQGVVALVVTPNDTVTNVEFTIQSGDDPAVGPASVSESPAFTYFSPAVDIDATLGATIAWTVEYTVGGVATSQSGVSRFHSAAPALISGDAIVADDGSGNFAFVFDDDGNQLFV